MASYSRDNDVPLENVVFASPGLHDHLMWQLRMIDFPDGLSEICEFIVGNLESSFLKQAMSVSFHRLSSEDFSACGHS